MVRPISVPNAKFTMEFNGGVNGWTESHFYTTTAPLSSTTLQADAIALAKKRCACLDGVNAKLFAMRLSIDNISRDSVPLTTNSFPPSPTTGYSALGGPDPSDHTKWAYQTVQMSWHVQLTTVNDTTNPQEYIAGMPASVTQTGPFPFDASPPTPASFLGIYFQELINGKWGALGRNWNGVAYLLSNITFIPAAGAEPTQFEFTVAAPFPAPSVFPTGAYVRLTNATYNSPQKRLRLNGTYQVLKYNPVNGQLFVACPRALVDPNFQSFGAVESASGAVFAYDGWVYRYMTHRKRGRPFGGGRGRR